MKTFAALVLLSCVILASPAPAQLYSVTDLGTLGGNFSVADGINNTGTIVGDAGAVIPSTSSSRPSIRQVTDSTGGSAQGLSPEQQGKGRQPGK